MSIMEHIMHMCRVLTSSIFSFTSKALVRSISLVSKDVSPRLQADYKFCLYHPRRAHIFHLKVVEERLMCTHVVSVIFQTCKKVIRLRVIPTKPTSVRMDVKVKQN